MRTQLKIFAAGVALALAGIGAAAVLTIRAEAADPLAYDSSLDPAIGESLVLVAVASLPDVADAQAELAKVDARFGHLRGFSIARTDDFDVTGILVRTSMDRFRARCETVGGTVRAYIETVPVTLECPVASKVVDSAVPAALRHVPISEYSTAAFPSPCGGIGQPPCQAARYAEILDGDGRLRTGEALVVTAFRTKRGAEEFLDLARAVGAPAPVVLRATKLGGGDVGLGQEPHPDGSGALTGPLRDQASYQT